MPASSAVPRPDVLIAGGRVIDPSRRLDRVGDLLLADGRIAGLIGLDCDPPGSVERRFEAAGLVVAPGFVDLHAHLRTPGQEHKETIATGTRAAAKGGFT